MTMTVYLILGLLLCVSVALNMHLVSRLQAEAEQDYYEGVPAWQDPAKILSLEEPGWIDAEELEPELRRGDDPSGAAGQGVQGADGGQKMVDEYISRRAAEDAVRACCLEASACNLQCIKDIPAVDVRPVVRGKWKSVPHKRARVCSRCEADEPYKFADDDANVYNFCPNCGAKMEG